MISIVANAQMEPNKSPNLILPGLISWEHFLLNIETTFPSHKPVINKYLFPCHFFFFQESLAQPQWAWSASAVELSKGSCKLTKHRSRLTCCSPAAGQGHKFSPSFLSAWGWQALNRAAVAKDEQHLFLLPVESTSMGKRNWGLCLVFGRKGEKSWLKQNWKSCCCWFSVGKVC